MCCMYVDVWKLQSQFQTCHQIKVSLICHWSMHELRSMKKLQGDCVSWLVLLAGVAQLLLLCGEGSPGTYV